VNPILAELFRHNLWANLTVIDFCASVPDDVLEMHVPGTFGTIRDTLGHLAGAEEGYLTSLAGGEVAHAAAPDEAAPTLAILRERALRAGEVLALATVREHARRSGEGLVAYAAAVAGDPVLRVSWHGQTHEMPASLFLVQAIDHATEHRTQIKTALTQAGLTPPEIDGWTWSRLGGG
jgi:uncharacterized damage-inducible protein DinB